MSDRTMMHCANCGAEWPVEAAAPVEQAVPAEQPTSLTCPICGYRVASGPSSPEGRTAITADYLESQLVQLIAGARESGLEPETIVRILRDELEFAAELMHAGRQICVQIVDLGAYEGMAMARPMRDRAAVLRGRSLNQP
jgi:hypothetical protein